MSAGRHRRFSGLAAIALAALSGCASSGAAGPRPGATPPHAGLSAREPSGQEIATWLEDNPVVLARKKADAEEADRLAAERAFDEAERRIDDEQDAEAAAAPPSCDDEMKKATEALEKGDYAEAEKWAKIVVEKNPRDYQFAYVVLGDVAMSRKQYQAAHEHYARAMELDPNDGWAVQRAAESLVKLGKIDDARKLLRGWLAAHPDADGEAWDALAWLDVDAGDAKESEHAFQAANRIAGGKDPEAWYGLALLGARRNDARATAHALAALFDLQPARRVVVERDPTFFKMRWWKEVGDLFSPSAMAAARAAPATKPDVPKPAATTSAPAAPPASATAPGSEEASATPIAVPNGAKIAIDGVVLFDSGSARLRAESAKVLDAVATFLKAQRASIEWVEVSGHADKIGDETFNVSLSELRARSVRDALVARGVDPKLLRTKGYGEYCPLDDGDGPIALQKNRRVAFAVSSGGQISGEELTCSERMRRWLKSPRVARKK